MVNNPRYRRMVSKIDDDNVTIRDTFFYSNEIKDLTAIVGKICDNVAVV